MLQIVFVKTQLYQASQFADRTEKFNDKVFMKCGWITPYRYLL